MLTFFLISLQHFQSELEAELAIENASKFSFKQKHNKFQEQKCKSYITYIISYEMYDSEEVTTFFWGKQFFKECYTFTYKIMHIECNSI